MSFYSRRPPERMQTFADCMVDPMTVANRLLPEYECD